MTIVFLQSGGGGVRQELETCHDPLAEADPVRDDRSGGIRAPPKAAGVKINTFNLPTLTPGLWDIQVSYTARFGCFSPPDDTVVTIAPGKTTSVRVKVPYQVPSIGIVKGTLTLLGIPGSSSSVVQACASAPVAGVCTGQVVA